MERKLLEVKAAFVAAMSAVGAFLGWRGIIALVWVAAMALDYISGTMAACKMGEWSSAVARDGLWHKLGMFVAVVAAAIVDGVMTIVCTLIPGMGLDWPGALLPLVHSWYIFTEIGSVLENAVKMGANVPEWLIKIMKVSLKKVDEAATPKE